VIKQGLNVVSMTLGGIRLVDSYRYLPLALAELPKAFGFEDQVLKGLFPHFFNRLENQEYCGPLPAKHYFGDQDLMTSKKAHHIDQWYEANKDKEFDFRAEIERYA